MQQLSNFGTTTLSTTMLSGDTAAILTDGSVMPSSGDFVLLIENEYVLVTNISGNNITVTRGYAGTTAVTHSSGVTVKLVLSKEVLENYFGEHVQLGGYASRPSTPKTGTHYYANDIDLGWKYNGSNWDLIHPVYVPYTNRVDLSGWTSVNLSTSTWTDYNGVLVAGAFPTSSGENIRGYSKNLPSAPYKLNLLLRMTQIQYNFINNGLSLYDGTKFTTFGMFYNSGPKIDVAKYTNITTFSGTISYSKDHWFGDYVWFQIEDDNTNWYYRFSTDGNKYNQVFKETRNTFLTATKIAITAERVETVIPGSPQYTFLGYWEQ